MPLLGTGPGAALFPEFRPSKASSGRQDCGSRHTFLEVSPPGTERGLAAKGRRGPLLGEEVVPLCSGSQRGDPAGEAASASPSDYPALVPKWHHSNGAGSDIKHIERLKAPRWFSLVWQQRIPTSTPCSAVSLAVWGPEWAVPILCSEQRVSGGRARPAIAWGSASNPEGGAAPCTRLNFPAPFLNG